MTSKVPNLNTLTEASVQTLGRMAPSRVLSYFCCLAILAVSNVLRIYHGLPSTRIMAWLSASIVFLAIAIIWRPKGPISTERAEKLLPILFVTTMAGSIATRIISVGPGSQSEMTSDVVSLAVFLSFIAPPKGSALQACLKYLFPLLLIVFAILGFGAIRGEPNPPIDVFLSQQAGVKALINLHNPYTATIPDIYGPESPFFIPLFANGYSLFGFMYPPVIAILEVPSYLITGDVRYTHLVLLIVSAVLIAMTKKSWVSFSGAVLLLFNPFSVMMVRFAWVEPIAIFFFSLTLYAASRHSKAVPYLLGLFCASKQPLLAILPLVPLILTGPWEWRKIASFAGKSLAVVVVLYLPFFLWNSHAFVLSLVTVQLKVPLRPDLISYPAYAAARSAFVAPMWLPFLYLPIGFYLALVKAPRTVSGFAASVAFLLLPFFALSKQGSPNYYFLVLAILCCCLGSILPAEGQEPEST